VGDPPCKEAAGSYWEVYERQRAEATKNDIQGQTPMNLQKKAKEEAKVKKAKEAKGQEGG